MSIERERVIYKDSRALQSGLRSMVAVGWGVEEVRELHDRFEVTFISASSDSFDMGPSDWDLFGS